MVNKFKVLSPLYFLAVLFYFVFALNGFSLNEFNDLNSVLLHLTYTQTLLSSTTYSLSGVLWYMGLIMQLYIFAYLIYNLYVYNKNLCHVVVLAIHIMTFSLHNDIVATRFVGKYVLMFYIGMMSYLHFERIIELFNKRTFIFFLQYF